MTQILIACAVAMFICSGYTFLIPTYDWIVERQTARADRATRSASATRNRVTSKQSVA